MNYRIGRLGARMGVDRTAADQAVAFISQFFSPRGLNGKMRPLIVTGVDMAVPPASNPNWNSPGPVDRIDTPSSGGPHAMRLVRGMQGKMRSAELLAPSRGSASSSGV